jgi:hypothetical protein
MDMPAEYIPVPEIFWSFETGQPIRRCGLCDCDLMEPGTNYLIEKAFRNGETIFEHALCMDCHTESVAQMSAESMQRIHSYFSEHVDMEKRYAQALEDYRTDHEKWISHCLVKRYPAQECGEHQLYGFCIDKNLIFNGTPYILSGEVIDEILELLSSETIDALGELSDRLFRLDAPKNLLLM